MLKLNATDFCYILLGIQNINPKLRATYSQLPLYSGQPRDLELVWLVSSLARVRNSWSLFQWNACKLLFAWNLVVVRIIARRELTLNENKLSDILWLIISLNCCRFQISRCVMKPVIS